MGVVLLSCSFSGVSSGGNTCKPCHSWDFTRYPPGNPRKRKSIFKVCWERTCQFPRWYLGCVYFWNLYLDMFIETLWVFWSYPQWGVIGGTPKKTWEAEQAASQTITASKVQTFKHPSCSMIKQKNTGHFPIEPWPAKPSSPSSLSGLGVDSQTRIFPPRRSHSPTWS